MSRLCVCVLWNELPCSLALLELLGGGGEILGGEATGQHLYWPLSFNTRTSTKVCPVWHPVSLGDCKQESSPPFPLGQLVLRGQAGSIWLWRLRRAAFTLRGFCLLKCPPPTFKSFLLSVLDLLLIRVLGFFFLMGRLKSRGKIIEVSPLSSYAHMGQFKMPLI